MTTGSTMWIFIGVAAVAAIVLLLLNPAQRTANEPTPIPSTTVTTAGVERASWSAEAPMVNAGPDRTLGEREIIRLQGEGAMPGGGAVTFLWPADNKLGFFEDARNPATAYTAPSACDCEQKVILTLTATGPNGARASDSLVLCVRDPLACPTGTCQTRGGLAPVFDPCRAVEPVCPARPAAACASPCITEIPAYGGCLEAPVPCPCSLDPCGGEWASGWPFGPQPEHPRDRPAPRIDRQYSASIGEGSTMPVSGYISNPACLSVCFTWSASKGWLDGTDTLRPVYHAPESDRRDGETATITLTVYDAAGGRSYDQIRVRIVNADPM